MNTRKTILGSAFARALALPLAALAAHAADVTDGDVPVIMDEDGTHYVVGATGAYDLYLGGHMRAGDLNAVTLTIQQGSILTGDWGEIGYGSTSAATGGSSVLVTGSGSQWIMANGLYVGRNAANNTLTIADGATVSTPFSTIGDGGPGDNNTVRVTGVGSTFSSSGPTFASHGFTYVGYYGLNSQLIIENGGTATTWATLIGNDYPSSGTVTVTGDGSSWTTTGTSVVGRVSAGRTAAVGGGTGTLLVDDGGLVHADTLQVAQGATSTGTITIASGGTLEVTDDLSLGLIAGSTATVNLNTGGTLQIADNGSAAITAGAGTVAFNVAGGTLKVRTDTGGGVLTSSVPMTLSNASTIDTNGNTATLSGVLSGAGSLTKTDAGTLTLSGANTYSGATSIAGGRIQLTGTAGNSAFAVNSGGTLSGTGTAGTLTLNSGGTLAPGNSPGTLNAGNTTWNSGGAYEWEINDAAGAAGTNYDLLDITGALTLASTSGSPFTISLVSLTSGNAAGEVINFNPAQNYSYAIATATGGISGFATNTFTLDTDRFENPLGGGAWSLSQVGNNLNLNFTPSAIPEPSTYAMLAGLAGLAVAALRKKSRRSVEKPR